MKMYTNFHKKLKNLFSDYVKRVNVINCLHMRKYIENMQYARLQIT